MKNCILLSAYGFAEGSSVQTTSRSIKRMALLSVENSSFLIIPGLMFTSSFSSPVPDTRGLHFTHIFHRIHLPAILTKNVKERKKEVSERDTDVMLDVSRHM